VSDDSATIPSWLRKADREGEFMVFFLCRAAPDWCNDGRLYPPRKINPRLTMRGCA
jgi:hypothetical protein